MRLSPTKRLLLALALTPFLVFVRLENEKRSAEVLQTPVDDPTLYPPSTYYTDTPSEAILAREAEITEWRKLHTAEWHAMSEAMQLCLMGTYVHADAETPEAAIRSCQEFFSNTRYSFAP